MIAADKARRTVAALAILPGLAMLASACGASTEDPGHASASHQTAGTGARAAASTAMVSASELAAFGQWLKQRAAVGQFSGTALVARYGEPLLEAGYGLADRNARIRNTPQTKFCIASIGKLFTAVAIAQLVEQHKLSFGGTIGKYLTGFPAAVADHVTIADLLTMTSGLGDVALGSPHPPATLAGMMRLIDTEPLQFKPGSRFDYSNDGYIVLGAIIQAVTGQSYDSYVREHILDPAGMTDTFLGVYTPAQVPGMAHGYALLGAGTALTDISGMPQIGNPSGGAYSTVGDLLKFAQALMSHRLLSPAMTATVLVPRVNSPQPGGPPVDKYTYGFAFQAVNGVSFVGHNGGTPGYEGQIDIYPKSGYAAIILANQDQVLVPAIQRSEELLTGS
jgi:CubicO group peptidase (beta-lactamase class C family)